MEQDTNTGAVVKSNEVMGCSRTSLIVGGILIGIIAILGLAYLLDSRNTMMDEEMMGEMMKETMTPSPGTPEEVAASEEATAKATAALSAQGSSDELGAIEQDLNATDLNSLGDPSKL